jgi:ATP synthase protein I
VGVSGQGDPVLGKIYRIIRLQVVVAAVISLLLLPIYGALVAASAFAGGAIGFITSWVYARKMTVPAGSDPRLMLRAHAVAEAWKLGLIVILFVAVLTFFKGVATLPLLLTFIATLAVYWVALLFVY